MPRGSESLLLPPLLAKHLSILLLRNTCSVLRERLSWLNRSLKTLQVFLKRSIDRCFANRGGNSRDSDPLGIQPLLDLRYLLISQIKHVCIPSLTQVNIVNMFAAYYFNLFVQIG